MGVVRPIAFWNVERSGALIASGRHLSHLAAMRRMAVRRAALFGAVLTLTSNVHGGEASPGASALRQARTAWDHNALEAAEPHYREALEKGGLAPAEVLEGYVRLGSIRAALGRKDAAIAAFRAASVLDERFPVPTEAGARVARAGSSFVMHIRCPCGCAAHWCMKMWERFFLREHPEGTRSPQTPRFSYQGMEVGSQGLVMLYYAPMAVRKRSCVCSSAVSSRCRAMWAVSSRIDPAST